MQAAAVESSTVSSGEGLARAGVAVAAMIVLGLAFIVYWPTVSSLTARWENTVHRTYTHGYLIVALSFWLLWRARGTMSKIKPSPLAAVLLMVLSMFWLVFWRAGVQTAHQALFPMIALLGVLACHGLRNAKACAVPIGYLYFAIPVWDEANAFLQWISVFAVRALLRLTGIPAYFTENKFQIPAGAFEIAGGCSGLHFFIVGFAIAALYGEVNRDSPRTRLLIIILAALLAMTTNWLRIYIIILAGHLTDMQHHLVVEEHYSFGWLMFAAAMLVFFFVVRRWPVAALDASPKMPSMATRELVRGMVVAAACLSVSPIWLTISNSIEADRPLHSLPSGASDPSEAALTWKPKFEGRDHEVRQRYDVPAGSVEVYLATYLSQKQGKELTGEGNSVLGESMRPVTFVGMDGVWNELIAEDAAGVRWLVRFAYRIDDDWYNSAMRAQLMYGARSLLGASVSSVLVARARCSAQCELAREALSQFASKLAE